MNEQVEQYRRESRDFREFIELWVHEIKLPVAGLQLMAHNDGNERYATQLARIDDMVQNVLFYARSESAEKDYVIRETSLARSFANVALKNRDELLERGIMMETEGLDVKVMTDGKWLEYMLGQLMANSVKYASPERDTIIRVSAEDLEDRVVLHFWDNGIGIAPEDLPHVFEKSFTGANGRIGQNSTGFGLYIIDKLCERLGHQVRAASEQGQWTEVTISFGKNLLFELEG
jgi:signal transduction histidine kinase